MLHEFLNQEYFQNRVADYLVFLALLGAGIVLVTVIKKVSSTYSGKCSYLWPTTGCFSWR
jgi:hypothetical protein